MSGIKITSLQVFFLFILMVGLTSHVLIVPFILQSNYRDSWLTALFSLPLLLIWGTAIFGVMKLTEQQSLFVWFKKNYNSFAAWAVVAPLILLCLGIILMTIKTTTDWTKIAYLNQTPYFVTTVLYLFTAAITAISGLRTFTLVTVILLPLVITFELFVFFIDLQFADYSYLFPLLTSSSSAMFKGTFYALSGGIEFILILGIQQYLSKKMKFGPLLITLSFISLLSLWTLITGISIFGPIEMADQMFPLSELWDMVLIGRYISHLDFIAIYQWIAGSVIRMALAFYLIFDLMQIQQKKKRNWLIFALACSIVMLQNLVHFSVADYAKLLQNYYFPFFTSIFYFFPFVLLFFIWLKRRSLHATK